MLIQVPSKKLVLLLEWKAIQIKYLDVDKAWGRKGKAERLRGMVDANEILDPRFSQHDAWRPGQTVRNWIVEGPIKGITNNRRVNS